MTIWFDLNGVSGWQASGSRKRSGQRRYSDLAIEVGLTIRQVQSFVRSLLRLAGLDLPVPDFSTLCRCSASLNVTPASRVKSGLMTLIVDSTELWIHGGWDWMREKHGVQKPRKTWRKLHIGFDPEAGEMVTACLPDENVSDPGALPKLLAPIEGKVDGLIADGAHDGAPTT